MLSKCLLFLDKEPPRCLADLPYPVLLKLLLSFLLRKQLRLSRVIALRGRERATEKLTVWLVDFKVMAPNLVLLKPGSPVYNLPTRGQIIYRKDY